MKIFKIILSIIFSILSIFSGYMFIKLDILPNIYLYLTLIGIFIVLLLGTICLFLKSKWIKTITIINYLIIIAISTILILFGMDTLDFMKKGFNNFTKEVNTYDVVVLKNSNIDSIANLKNTSGYIDDGILNIDSLTFNVNEYSNIYDMYNDLKKEVIEAMIIDEAYIDIIIDTFKDYEAEVKVINTFNIESIKEKKSTKIAELKPINIYISGSDARSTNIYSKSRSDANLILSVNPNTHKILLTSIPRDYYVQQHNTSGLKDKLTHVGIYGVDASRETLEDLFDIEIEYSIKVGFSGVEAIVDEIDGIDIDSDISFKSYHIPGWTVKKGIQHMDGKQALAYSRERYAYLEGDRHRAANQAQVIDAIVNKITTDKSLLINTTDILNKLTKYYITDIPFELISLYIKEQIEEMNEWEVNVQSVSGKDAYDICRIGEVVRYVMYPNKDDVNNAHDAIVNLMNE